LPIKEHVLEQIEKLSTNYAQDSIWYYIQKALHNIPSKKARDSIHNILKEQYKFVEENFSTEFQYNSLETIKFIVARNEDDASVSVEFLSGVKVPCQIRITLIDSYYSPKDEEPANDFDCGMEYYDVEIQDWFENDQWEPSELDTKTFTLKLWNEDDKQTFMDEIGSLFKQWDGMERWTLTENQKNEIATMLKTQFLFDMMAGGKQINEYPVDGSIDGTVHSNIGDAKVFTYKRSKFEVITWREYNDIGTQGQQTYKRLGRA